MIRKEIWLALDSAESYQILDKVAGGDWGEGGCAILAFALQMVFRGEIFCIYNSRLRQIEHFGLCTHREVFVDAGGVYCGGSDWLAGFCSDGVNRTQEDYVVVEYTVMLDNSIVINKDASESLARLIVAKISGA